MTVMFNAQWLAPLHGELTSRAEIYIGSDDQRLLRAFATPGIAVRRCTGEAAACGKLLFNLATAIRALTHTTFESMLKPGARRARSEGRPGGTESVSTCRHRCGRAH